ncbi:hypothetical protein ACILG0_01360 [Pseudomonadota bacterium AL_CKDN230030165-1A_HGKHYDSX7]
MKSHFLRRAGAAVLLAAITAPAFAGPGWGSHGYYGHGRHGYYGSGYNHHHGGGSSSAGWWVGGAIALAAVGALLAANATDQAYASSGAQISGGGVTYTTPGGVYDPGYGDAGYGGTYVAPYENQVQGYGSPVYSGNNLTAAPTYETPQGYPVPQYGQGDPAAVNSAAIPVPQAPPVQRAARADCQRYAINESGYDPSIRSAWTTQVMVDTYQRYLQSCQRGPG